MYKLLALDIDGTLLKSDGEVCKSTFDSIKKAAKQGALVTLTTGRTLSGVKRYIDMLGIDLPIILYNGAMIVDTNKNVNIFTKCLNAKDARQVIDLGLKYGTTMLLWSNDQLYVNMNNHYVQLDKQIHGIEPIVIKDYDAIISKGLAKIVWLDDAEKIDSMRSEIAEVIDDSISFCTSAANYLEFFDKNVSKANALAKIAEIHHIKQEEIIAIGDGENDISMIGYAGLGIAMENASERVKAVAKFVTTSNDNQGIARALEKFLL